MISEKIIYNTFLKISRSQSGLPFRLRKQWHGFEETPYYTQVLRLKNFFSRNKSVDVNEFFSAPFTIYPGESGFDLAFYSSPKAIKIYTLAQKKKLFLSPDMPYHLNNIAKGLKYIWRFCQENNIKVLDYPKFKNGVHPICITHIKERRVSIYNMFAFDSFEGEILRCEPEALRFVLGDIYDNIAVFRTKYLGSSNAKALSSLGLKKLLDKENNS
ncbi:hypothetical protein EBR43_02265 [bacterium]|nr:hypothetical protein [bacterium]